MGDGYATQLTNQYAVHLNDIGIQAQEETSWTNFLNANDIKSQALAFSATYNAANISKINPIAYDGIAGAQLGGIYVADPANLSSTLVALAQTPVTGTLIGASGVDAFTGQTETVAFGADGGYVYSVEVLGGTFTYNLTPTESVTKTGGDNLTYTFNASTDQLVVTDAAAHKELTINVLTGAYSYIAPADTLTVVNVSMRDKDGDAGTVALTLNVNPTPATDSVATLAAVVSEEGLAGGFADTAGALGDTTNATLAMGSANGYTITSITGPSGITSGTPATAVTWSSSLSGDILTLTGTAGANTVRTVEFNNGTDQYSVNLLRGLNHNASVPEGLLDLKFVLGGTQDGSPIQTELNVRVEDDIAGGTLILGTNGIDDGTKQLVGDANANLVVGGMGSDVMRGGAGADTFAWFPNDWGPVQAQEFKPTDSIMDFRQGFYNIATTGTNAADRIDLSRMLLGETFATRNNYINVEVIGSDTLLHIS